MKKSILNESELSLQELIAALWHYRVLFFCAIVLSILCSLAYVKIVPHIYKVEVIVEFQNPENSGLSLPSALESVSQAMPFNFGADLGANNKNFIPKFLGSQFLMSLAVESIEKDNLEKYCGYNPSPPKTLSLPGILVLMGISDFKMPTDEQKMERKILCTRSMFSIEQYKYKTIKTEAYKIFILHEDPAFAANFLNDAVLKFFENEKAENRRQHKEVTSYMYETLVKVELEKNEAKSKLSKTILENPSLALLANDLNANGTNSMRSGNSTQGLSLVEELGILKSQMENLADRKKLLQDFQKEGFTNPRMFINLIKKEGNYSNRFLAKLRKLEVKSLKASDIESFSPDILSEIRLLNDLMITIEEKISTKTIDLKKQDTQLEEYLQANYEYQARNMIYEKLKSSIEGEAFKVGLNLLFDNDIHTFAVSPLGRASPNSIFVLATFLVCSILLAMLYVFVRHFINGYIYHVEQIRNFFDAEKISILSLSKQLAPKLLLKSSVTPPTSYFSAMEDFLEKSNIGLFIEIGRSRGKSLWISESVAAFFAKLYLKTNKSVLVDSVIEKSSLINSASKYSIDRNISLDQENKVEKGHIAFNQSKLKATPNSYQRDNNSGIYKSFDHAFIACDGSNDFDEIAHFADLSDFFVIIIRYGHIKKSTLQTFLFSLQKYEDKLKRIILVR